MHVYCVYPAKSKAQYNCQILLKRTNNVFKGVFYHVLAYNVFASYPLFYMNHVPEKLY